MLVIGNGESRTDIDIDSINDTKIGCNAILRDYLVEHLVCVDRKMVREAITAEYKSNIYTRSNWIDEFKAYGVMTVPELPYKGKERPDEPFQWGSGPYAVLIAAQKAKNETVHLIGFDQYSSTSKVNNIYKDTRNYDRADKRAVDPRYWIHQIGKVFECYAKTNFVVYELHEKMQKAWNYPNVSLDKLSSL